MTKTRLKELQTEIARLQEIDNKITEKVSVELSNADDDCQRPNEDCEHESLMDCDCVTEEIEVTCSRALDIEWANNSI
tara:strand:+ start:346 stop:579 length:234 start_codon:yes stop_codon:yes gene_type:complete